MQDVQLELQEEFRWCPWDSDVQRDRPLHSILLNIALYPSEEHADLSHVLFHCL